MSREEAIRLVTAAGFTFWQEGVAFGDAVRPYLEPFFNPWRRGFAAIGVGHDSSQGDRASEMPTTFENLLDPSLASSLTRSGKTG